MNVYTPSPICVPARAAVATGQYVHKIGYWDNAMAYDGRITGWGHILQRQGFDPVSIGKLHYRCVDDDTGFSKQIVPMHIQDGIGQVWGPVRNPLPENSKSTKIIGTVGEGYSDYNKYDESVAQETENWLRNSNRNKPWILFASFVAPHFPLIVPREFL